ncbi:MAG: OmpH family outer membrane protein [Planctomycetes bacterium]|nr:OmpH family outer membrane protein [Planctomycetota bacterium]
MRKFGVCLALTGAAVWLTGCGMQFGGQSSSRGGLAVVDLDKVAAETGRKFEMDQAFEVTKNSVNQQLAKLTNEARGVLEAKLKEAEAKAKELGEDAALEDKQKVGQMTLNARNNLAQVQNVAGSKLNEYKQVQIATFRNEIKPLLQEVSAKRGLSIVIPKNDGLLLAVDPGVDITDDVIKAYNAKRPTPAAAAPVQAAAAAPAAKNAEAPAKKETPTRAASKAAADSDKH